jgi:hypothetical protein
MHRSGLALAALLLLGASASAQSLNDAAKAMIGSWEFSNADRDKICIVTFKAERTASGYGVEFDPKCAEAFPLVRDIAGWNYPDNDLLHFVDAQGRSLIDFSEVETGMFEAPTQGLGVLFLQNTADAIPPAIPPDQVAGDWVLMRDAGKPLCTITLSTTAADDGFALSLKPGCDPVIVRLSFARWRLDRDELMIAPARGNSWRFEQSDANTWSRVPASANPYTLVRQ